ncbi:unnamed protein product, partial [Brenthis ino]
MEEPFPTLVSCKPLTSEYSHLQEIKLSSSNFTVGRGLDNLLQIPLLSISREHCKLRKDENNWIIEDYSMFGIIINKKRVGKGNMEKLKHGDIIAMDTTHTFVYKFLCEDEEVMPTPSKRMKLDPNSNNTDFIEDMKEKFEQSQNNEIKHLEEKINNTNQIKNTNILLKEQMQVHMVRKMNLLNTMFATKIENLTGEKDEKERQRVLLVKERDAQLETLKQDMEGKINELKEQIKKHSEMETDLFEENESLKMKLAEERAEFLLELNRESSVKQDVIDKLQAKMKEKEKMRLKEKSEFMEILKKKTLELRLEKDKELQELKEQRELMEKDLTTELNNIKKNLKEQVEIAEKQKQEAQLQLNEQIEALKKLENEDKAKMDKLKHEREEMEKKLRESQMDAEKNIKELKARVTEREVELAALAAERIQKQAEQSSEVIHSLQEQLEKVRKELKSVENEKKLLQEGAAVSESMGECSKSLGAIGDIMESELQCTICAELFICATTLNCSHSFCKYCINMWKKKKKDCPICRTPITSECKSLVLDSFIEKMVESLTPEMKQKRQDMLDARKEVESKAVIQGNARTSRRYDSYDEEEEYSDIEYIDEEEVEDDCEIYDLGIDDDVHWELTDEFDSDSGSDGTGWIGGGRVAGREGAYYGGYGRCYRCGARGHWAPGCPLA